MKHICWAIAALLFTAGCTNEASTRLATYDRLEWKIRGAYRDHALEGNGLCIRPDIRIITQSEFLRDTDEKLVVRLRFSIRSDSDRFDPDDIFQPVYTCPPFGERVFTFDKTDGGLVFNSMSGPNRPKTNTNFNK